jgi:group I intron endonuclease
MTPLFDTALNGIVKEIPGIYYLKVKEQNYVGSSLSLKTRLMEHRSALLRKNHDNPRMQLTFNKYGQDKVWFSVLELCDKNVEMLHLLTREKYWIDTLGPSLNVKQDPISEYNAPTTSKPVYQFDLQGRVVASYNSGREAQRKTMIKATSIVRVCGGHLKSAGGYLWSYNPRCSASYDLERSKWKWKSVVMTDTNTGEEMTFKNIADAARYVLTDDTKFDSICATISSLCKGKGKTLMRRYKYVYQG